MQKFQVLTLVISSYFVLSCSQQPDTSALSSNGKPAALLIDEVKESSGLACLADQRFLTMNDSGNPAVLYQLDSQGEVTARISVDAQNSDWEALAVHQGTLWIADIGNNSGQRSQLQLYKTAIPKTGVISARTETFQLHYPQPPSRLPAHFQHELDAEALVNTGEQLLLFSKNWLGLRSRVYQVDTSKPASQLIELSQTSALPGLITDAAYSPKQQVFVLTGYQNFRANPFPLILSGDFGPFIAILDKQFQLIKTIAIDSGGQVEGLCLDQADNIWLSQEESAQKPAMFWRFGNLAAIMTTTD